MSDAIANDTNAYIFLSPCYTERHITFKLGPCFCKNSGVHVRNDQTMQGENALFI